MKRILAIAILTLAAHSAQAQHRPELPHHDMDRQQLVNFMLHGYRLTPGGLDIYIASSSAGGNTGANCANAKAWTEWTNAGDWVGDNILHICGTRTEAVNTASIVSAGAGTSGHVITVKFETGAVLTSPAWPSTLNPSGAIHITHDFVTVEGGTNGTITATDNGTSGYSGCTSGSCSHQINSGGVITGGAHNTVQNVTVTHLFMHQPLVNDGGDGAGTTGINFNGANGTATSNKVDSVDSGIACGESACVVTSNEVFNANHIVVVGVAGGATKTGISIRLNNLHDSSVWDQPDNAYHHNCIFLELGDATVGDGVVIDSNYCHGLFGNDSAYFISTGGTHITSTCLFVDPAGFNGYTNVHFTNNVCETDAGLYNFPDDAFVTAGDSGVSGTMSGLVVANNTFVDNSGAGSYAIAVSDKSGTALIKNDIVKTTSGGNLGGTNLLNSQNPWTTITLIDYNIYAGVNGSIGGNFVEPPGGTTWAGWQSDGFDTHGSNPIFSALNLSAAPAFVPQAGSVAIGTCVNLTSLGISQLNVDKNGNARPSSGAWDCGAVNSGSTPPPPPPGPSVIIPFTLANGQVGVTYPNTQLTVTGGVPPDRFSATGIPAGLSLSSMGLISGTPTSGVVSSPKVTVTDANGASLTQGYTLTITAPVPPPVPTSDKFYVVIPLPKKGKTVTCTIKVQSNGSFTSSGCSPIQQQ